MPILEQVKFKNKEDKRHFAFWCVEEIRNTEGDRGPLIKKWQDNMVQWRAPMPKGIKEFPWVGASNLEFPLTAIHTDPVYSDFLQTLDAPEDYWTVVARKNTRTAYAHPMTKFLTTLDRTYIKMRQVNRRALMDNVIHGTAIYKNHWLHERKEISDYNDEGRVERKVRRRTHPLVECTPLQHFLIPADAWDIDPDAPIGGARWVAQELHFTKNQLLQRARSEGSYAPDLDRDAVEKVVAFESDKENPVDRKIQSEDSYTPFREPRIRIMEVWARYDVDGDGIEEDVVALIHLESFTILRCIHSPFLHGKRPFHKTNYLPGFGFYGIGLAEADEWAQATATKLLNAQIDNILLANSRMFSAPLGSGITADEDIYPGKIWFVGPNEQIGEVRLGEVYPSLMQIQQQIMGIAEQRTGVSELRQGNIQNLPDRTPATSLMNAMQQGSKRFDMILSNIRHEHSELGARLLQNATQQYHEDPVEWEGFINDHMSAPEADKVVEVLSEKLENVRNEYGVQVTATSAQHNKEAEKQSFLGLMQILTQIYGQLVQTAMLIEQAPPGTPMHDTVVASFSGGVQLLERLLEKFDIQNPEEYVPNLEQLGAQMQQREQELMAQQQQGGMGPQGAQMGGAQGPLDPAQIGQLLGLA